MAQLQADGAESPPQKSSIAFPINDNIKTVDLKLSALFPGGFDICTFQFENILPELGTFTQLPVVYN